MIQRVKAGYRERSGFLLRARNDFDIRGMACLEKERSP